MNGEIKQRRPSVVRAFCELIRDYGMTDKVPVASFWSSTLNEFRRTCPEVATSASTHDAFKILQRK